jgi:excinuclease UvrABC ATPase subunit
VRRRRTIRKIKRKRFEEQQWQLDNMGYPFNILAEKDCMACHGHGVIDDGHFAPLYRHCDECWR